MRVLVVATGNAHKAQEFAHILAPLGIGVRTLGELVPGFPEPEETAPEFAGNARIKALAAAALLPEGTWIVADDSGLAVDPLSGEPGVYSARFAQRAGNGQGDADNRAELVRRLRALGFSEEERAPAAFVCSLHLLRPQGELAVTGRCPGAVRLSERGENGFGYDSLFHPQLADGTLSSRTFAEMQDDEKNALSHRGRALAELARLLPQS